MKSLIISISLSVFVIISLASCTPPQHIKEALSDLYKPLNVLPMYGAPDKVKTDGQKKSDKDFIESIVKSEGSRKIGAKRFSAWGWSEIQKGNKRVAMMRFNQAWLLNPEYYQPYWGFGALTLSQERPKSATVYFEKALSLIDEKEQQKARLLVDAAKAYALQAGDAKPGQSELLYSKSKKLTDDAIIADPSYKKAYYFGALIAYRQSDYARAWEIVKKSRVTNSYKFDKKFLDVLTEKMPEPK